MGDSDGGWFCAMAITRTGGSGTGSGGSGSSSSLHGSGTGALKRKIDKASRRGRRSDYRTRIYRSKDPYASMRLLNSPEAEESGAGSQPFSLVAVSGPFEDETSATIFEKIWRNRSRGAVPRTLWGRAIADYFHAQWWMSPAVLFDFAHLGVRHEENGDVYLYLKRIPASGIRTP
jgi:hypothetical protein